MGGPEMAPHTPQRSLVAPRRSRGAPRPPTLVAPRRSRGAPRPPTLVAPRRSRGAPRPPAFGAPRRSRAALLTPLAPAREGAEAVVGGVLVGVAERGVIEHRVDERV